MPVTLKFTVTSSDSIDDLFLSINSTLLFCMGFIQFVVLRIAFCFLDSGYCAVCSGQRARDNEEDAFHDPS